MGLVDMDPVVIPVKGNVCFLRIGNDLSPSIIPPNYHSTQFIMGWARQKFIICLCTLIWTLLVSHTESNQRRKPHTKELFQGSWKTVLFLYLAPLIMFLNFNWVMSHEGRDHIFMRAMIISSWGPWSYLKSLCFFVAFPTPCAHTHTKCLVPSKFSRLII